LILSGFFYLQAAGSIRENKKQLMKVRMNEAECAVEGDEENRLPDGSLEKVKKEDEGRLETFEFMSE
jgi:hypothetical protein